MNEEFGLYLVVTDPVAGYVACTLAAVECGLRYVQLRMKNAVRSEVTRVGHAMRAITRGTATRFIVNDDLSVARAVDADGLHLGQSDMTVAVARQLWPESETKLFGLSTHSAAQAFAAVQSAPDYIGVGPVYATPTKRVADPVLGVDCAAAIVHQSEVLAVAIGGIDRNKLPHVLAAGMRNYAVVRYVCQRAQPSDAIRELLDTASEFLANGPARITS
jgi:thiamine-phosphate pyrophosphorylase